MHPHNGAESAAPRPILPGWCRMLIEAGDLDQQSSEAILRSIGTERFAHHLLAYGVVSAWKVAHAMSMSFQIPILDLDAIDEKSLPHTALHSAMCRSLQVVVIGQRSNRLTVGIIDPSDLETAHSVRFMTRFKLDWVVVEYDKLRELWARRALGTGLGKNSRPR